MLAQVRSARPPWPGDGGSCSSELACSRRHRIQYAQPSSSWLGMHQPPRFAAPVAAGAGLSGPIQAPSLVPPPSTPSLVSPA